ncbi:MAG: hypothetical protein WC824_15730, partial [Bacteroidota bacterium]
MDASTLGSTHSKVKSPIYAVKIRRSHWSDGAKKICLENPILIDEIKIQIPEFVRFPRQRIGFY